MTGIKDPSRIPMKELSFISFFHSSGIILAHEGFRTFSSSRSNFCISIPVAIESLYYIRSVKIYPLFRINDPIFKHFI